jgi:hypothetical protein
MNKQKTIITIAAAALTAGLTAAIGLFPDLKGILTGLVGLITAVAAYLNGANNDPV